MSKAKLSVEMNHLFEFYAEVREGDTVLYTGPTFADAIYAKRHGLIWMENNGYELDEPEKQPDRASEIIAEMERTLDKMLELVRSL